MSKGSQQQQPTTRRDRVPTPVPLQKQTSKNDGNGAKTTPPREAGKPSASTSNTLEGTVIPSLGEQEDDFFARGEMNSSPPAAMDVTAGAELEDLPEIRPLTPAQIERRARLRRIVGSVVGAAAVLTAVVGAKALSATPAKVTATDSTLNVPHQVVPSIAMAAQEEPSPSKKAEGVEKGAAIETAAPAAAETAPVAENAAPMEGTGDPAAKNDEPAATAAAPVAAARRLPVIDVEIPAASDPAIDRQWESAAKNLTSQDFKGADSVFADLGKRGDAATREAARLARAVWWTANGRQNEVKPVIADLAANATTPSVRQHAQTLLRAN